VSILLAYGVLAAAGVAPVEAACNIIPGTSRAYRATLGTTDRPFARPGDFIKLALAPACDSSSPGFGATAADNVATFVFTPPSGTNDVVVVGTDCTSL
jgi:hypothetical protein